MLDAQLILDSGIYKKGAILHRHTKRERKQTLLLNLCDSASGEKYSLFTAAEADAVAAKACSNLRRAAARREEARVRRTTWAARLGVRAAASTRSVSGRAAALARRGRATFATILGAQAGGAARPRTRCSRLCAGAPKLRPGQSQRCLDAVRGRRMRRLLGGGRAA